MNRRLEGVRVLVTRPKERAAELCFLLEDEGAEVVALPLLELMPPRDDRPLRAAAEGLSRYAWVLFASPAAVEALAEVARQAGTLERLKAIKKAAIGPRTARALRDLGLGVDAEAELATGPGLFDAVARSVEAGDDVLLPAAEEGRRELGEALEERGVHVTRVVAYRSEAAPLEAQVVDALRASPPRVALFASPRTAEAFVQQLGVELLRDAGVVAIGPTTRDALSELGIRVAAVAERPTNEALVEAAVRALPR